jgi:PAS domain-containing protein
VFTLQESVAVSILVIAKLDDQVEAINTALRAAGQAVRCYKVEKLADLEAAIVQHKPLLIAVFENASQTHLSTAAATLATAAPDVALLLITNDVTEDSIAAAIARGARDAVSLNNIGRLQAVALRELRASQNALNLKNVMHSASQFRNELNSLKQVSVEAIADIQEGIIVTANPAWYELFAYAPDADLTGQPIMDLCAAPDRSALKGALQA